MSIVIMILTLVYALLKFNTLYTRQDPTIYSETFKDSTDMMRMKETDIVMAFALESYQHKELKEDPRYIRTIAYTYVKHSDGRKEYYPISMHKCTEEDWKKFHSLPLHIATKARLDHNVAMAKLDMPSWQRLLEE